MQKLLTSIFFAFVVVFVAALFFPRHGADGKEFGVPFTFYSEKDGGEVNTVGLFFDVLIFLVPIAAILFSAKVKAGSKIEDFEAKLASADPSDPGLTGQGKVERERWSDGHEEFKLHVRQLSLPDGATVDVYVQDTLLGSFTIRHGAGELLMTGEGGKKVPAVKAGEVIEVRYRKKPVLHGVFYED